MRFKELIGDLGHYALESKDPLLVCNSRDVSEELLLSNDESVRLMTYVSINEFVGKRYVFRDEEPRNFNMLRKEYDVMWINGRPAVESEVINTDIKSEESRYFHKILRDGGKPGEVFFRSGVGTYPFLCLKPENWDYNRLRNELREIFRGSN